MFLRGIDEPAPLRAPAAFDRRQRHATSGRHLGQLHFGDEAQRERHAFVVRQCVEHAIRGANRLVRLTLRSGHRHLGHLFRRHEADPAPPPPPANPPARREHGERGDPAAQRGSVLETADTFEHADEHVLDDVGNLGIDPERARHQPFDQRFVSLHQHRARDAIAAMKGRDQLGIVIEDDRASRHRMRTRTHLAGQRHRYRHISTARFVSAGPKKGSCLHKMKHSSHKVRAT